MTPGLCRPCPFLFLDVACVGRRFSPYVESGACLYIGMSHTGVEYVPVNGSGKLHRS